MVQQMEFLVSQVIETQDYLVIMEEKPHAVALVWMPHTITQLRVTQIMQGQPAIVMKPDLVI